MVPLSFGQHIRAKRQALQATDERFSLRRLAARLGIQPSYLSRLERGDTPSLSEDHILALAAELGENPDELLGLAGKVASDIRSILASHPAQFATLLRTLALCDAKDLAACQEALPLLPFFRDIQHQAKIGCFSRNLITGQAHWSEALFHIYGLPPEDQPPSFDASFLLVHPDDRQHVMAARRQALAEGGPLRYEYRFRRADGVWRHARAVVRGTTDTNGYPVRLCGTVQDVTTERQAMENLRSVARFPEDNPHPVLRLTKTGILAYANGACGPLLAAHGMAVGHPAAPAFVAGLDQALATGATQETDIAVNDRVLTFSLVPQADGRHVNGYGHDVTATRRAADDSTLEGRMLRALLDLMGDPVAFVTADNRFLRTNTAFTQAMGYSPGFDPADLIGKHLGDIFDETTTREISAINAVAMSGNVPMADATARALATTDGRKRYLHVSRAPLHDASGQSIGVCALARDVTEWRRTTEALADTEARYRRLFDDAILGAFRTTASGRILAVNPALARLFGYDSPADMIDSLGEAGLAFQNPDRRKEIMRRLGEDEGLLNFENTYRRKDGSLFIGNLHARMMPAEDGDAVLEGFIEDITARKAVERELADSEERLKTHLRNFPLPTLTFRLRQRDLVLTEANRAAEVLFRGRIGSCLGLTAEVLFSQSPDIYLALWDAFETRRPDKRRLPFRPPGMAEPGLFDMTFVFATPDTVMLHAEEVTALDRVREDLRRTSNQLQSMLDHVPCAVAFTDTEGQRIMANKAGEDVVGQNAAQALSALDVRDRRTLIEGGSITREETHRVQGVESHYLTTRTALRDEHGAVCASCTVALDITEGKQLKHDIETERDTLRTVLDNVPYAASLVGADGRTLYLNQRFIDLVGYRVDEIPDAGHWLERAYPDPAFRAQVAADWSNRQGRDAKRVYPVRCGDGRTRRLLFDAVALPDGSMLLTLMPTDESGEA